MATLCDYTTVARVKSYRDSTLSASDQLILDMIKQASKEIGDITNRRFFPVMVTQLYDTPKMNQPLYFSSDILEVSSLVNGDGVTIPSLNYRLYPLNEYPKHRLVLIPSQYTWQLDSNGTPYGAIILSAISGYHQDYPNAWVDTLADLAAAITTTTQTSVTATTGLVSQGDLIKIDSEFIYVSAVVTGTPDTLTLVRGVNGSTAATHLMGAAINRWDPGAELEMICRRAAVAYVKLRANPITDTVVVDGLTYTTPKDVIKWMDGQLRGLGLVRPGIG